MEQINEGKNSKLSWIMLTHQTLWRRYIKVLSQNWQFGAKLICVFGATGGGRDKWKRPEYGKISEKYCDEIILTNEDPYDENPEEILKTNRKRFFPNARRNIQG